MSTCLKLKRKTLFTSPPAFGFCLQTFHAFKPFIRVIVANHARNSAMLCKNLHGLKPAGVLFERVNVAAVEEARNVPSFSLKIRDRYRAVGSTANVKQNVRNNSSLLVEWYDCRKFYRRLSIYA